MRAQRPRSLQTHVSTSTPPHRSPARPMVSQRGQQPVRAPPVFSSGSFDPRTETRDLGAGMRVDMPVAPNVQYTQFLTQRDVMSVPQEPQRQASPVPVRKVVVVVPEPTRDVLWNKDPKERAKLDSFKLKYYWEKYGAKRVAKIKRRAFYRWVDKFNQIQLESRQEEYEQRKSLWEQERKWAKTRMSFYRELENFSNSAEEEGRGEDTARMGASGYVFGEQEQAKYSAGQKRHRFLTEEDKDEMLQMHDKKKRKILK